MTQSFGYNFVSDEWKLWHKMRNKSIMGWSVIWSILNFFHLSLKIMIIILITCPPCIKNCKTQFNENSKFTFKKYKCALKCGYIM